MANRRLTRVIAAAVALLLGALAATAQPARAQYPEFAPAGEGFAVRFPPHPTFHPNVPSRDIIAHSWTATDDGLIFFVGRGVTKNGRVAGDIEKTFKTDEHDILASMKGKLLHSARIEWPGPDGPLPALLFAVRVDDGYAEYLEAIRGKNVFAVLVEAQTDSTAARDKVDRLVRTLRITP